MTDPLALAAELVEIPSPTFGEGPYVDALASRLTALGLRVERHPVGAEGRDNLLAVAGEQPPEVLLSTHTDVVPPHLPPRLDSDRLYGRGACDTKGPLAAMLVAIERLLADGLTGFGLLLVVGEEQGHDGAIAAGQLPLRVRRLILGEPTENRVVAAQKGVWRVDLEASGVAAHSGYPALGRSAVHGLLDVLEAIRRRDWPSCEQLGATTVNVGTIAGGEAPNVSAASARASLLFRAVGPLAELEAGLAECLAAAPDVRVLRAEGNPPQRYEVPAGYETTVVAFNTDGPYLAPLGPVVLVGPGTIHVAHGEDEHVDRADLDEGARLYERLVRETICR